MLRLLMLGGFGYAAYKLYRALSPDRGPGLTQVISIDRKAGDIAAPGTREAAGAIAGRRAGLQMGAYGAPRYPYRAFIRPTPDIRSGAYAGYTKSNCGCGGK